MYAPGNAGIFAPLGGADRFFEWPSGSVDRKAKPFDFVTCPGFGPLRVGPRSRDYLRRVGLA